MTWGWGGSAGTQASLRDPHLLFDPCHAQSFVVKLVLLAMPPCLALVPALSEALVFDTFG